MPNLYHTVYMAFCFGVNKSENLFRLSRIPKFWNEAQYFFNTKPPNGLFTMQYEQWHLQNYWESPSVSDDTPIWLKFLNINPHLHSYTELQQLYETLCQVIFLTNPACKRILWLCQYLQIRALSSCLDVSVLCGRKELAVGESRLAGRK